MKMYYDPYRMLIVLAMVLLAMAGIYEFCREQPKLHLAKWRGYFSILTVRQADALHGRFDTDAVVRVLSLRRDGHSVWSISQRTGFRWLSYRNGWSTSA